MSPGAPAKYATQFGLMALMAVVVAVVTAHFWITRIAMAWTAVAFGVVAVAYATNRPGLLMKRPDGSQPYTAWLILGPYFVLARFSLAVYRRTNRRHAASAEVMPGVWFSRRLTRREMRQASGRWTAVLDLAAEFSRVTPPGLEYHALSILDGMVPTEAQLNEALAWIDQHSVRGNVLVHCALGHGRTGSVIVAWLLRHHHAADVDAGIIRLRGLRPTFGMSAEQTSALRRSVLWVDT